MARIELWNGDICDLEVDAIVSPASTSLWMSAGRRGELKRTGGDAIEFAAVRQAPRELGDAIVTEAGRLAAKVVIHAVASSATAGRAPTAIDHAARSAMARVRELGLQSVAFPALGTGIGGFPLDEAARVAVEAVRDELRTPSSVEHVIFALRGAAAYEAFAAALSAGEPAPARDRSSRPPPPEDRCMSFPMEPIDERREALVEARGARDPAARADRARGPLPRGEPAVPAARRARDAVLRPGAARAVRRRDAVGDRAPARRHRDRGAHRPARGAGRVRRLGRLTARPGGPRRAGSIDRVSSEPRAFAAVDRGTATVAASLVGRVDGPLAAPRLVRRTRRASRRDAVLERLRRRLAEADPELAPSARAGRCRRSLDGLPRIAVRDRGPARARRARRDRAGRRRRSPPPRPAPAGASTG